VKTSTRLASVFSALLASFLLALGLSLPAEAQIDNGPQFKGFSAKVTGDIYGQPKVFDDIDGDGKRDIIFGATDGQIHVFSAKGTEILRPPNWPKKVNSPILSDVNVVDIDNDGESDVLTIPMNGKIYCVAKNGREKWSLQLNGKDRLSSPEVSDVDGGGNFNIFVGTGLTGGKSGMVNRVDKDGRLIWEIPVTAAVSGKVVTADLDGDGNKEILSKDDNGKVYVMKLSGQSSKGWPQATVPNLTWPFDVGTADLNGDGIKEIYTTTPEKKFFIWKLSGEVRSEFPLTDGSHTAPRVADFNGDGKDEFIIGQADGTVMVCDEKGKALPGWPFKTKHSIYNTPQVVDLNGDGKLEVVYTAWNPEGIGKEAGYIQALSPDGAVLDGYPKFIGKSFAPLTFADLDGDGYLEMIAAGGINYTDDQLHVFPTQARVQLKMAVLGAEVSF